MSLNGLDSPAIQEAYASAVTEAGGWFLLKYTSRDSVELLGRGKSGVHEARLAIAKYEEPSPLYGLIIYRRRKVLIKYIPEGTSRLLQARTAVHFQDVTERYSPYETLLEITTSEGLNDTALASSFPLHTASPSASSSRLHEISEDGEDHGAAPRRTALQSVASTGSIFGTQRYKTEKRVEQLMSGERPQSPRRPTPSIQITSEHSSPLSTPLTSPLASPLGPPQKTSISQFLVRDESGQRSITSLGSQPSIGSVTEYAGSDVSAKSAESSTTVNEQSEAPVDQPSARPVRKSSLPSVVDKPDERPSYTERQTSGVSERSVERPSVSERPSMSENVSQKYDDEPYNFDHLFKPKVKLGPRPVAAGERTKRPTVASVSAIPATYRPTQKKPEPSRPKSQGPVNVPAPMPPVLPRPPPIPDMPEYTPRPVSRGSVKSLPSHRSSAMTPDKIRLMKAVELRKKQLRKSNPQQATFVPPKDEVPVVPNLPSERKVEAQEEPAKPPERQAEADPRLDEEKQAPSKKADSGIEMNYDLSGRREERPAEDAREEEASEAPADPGTLAQLEHRGSPSNRSLGLETSRPSSTLLGAQESTELLKSPQERPPNQTLARLDDATSNESSTLGRTSEGLGISTPEQPETTEVPSIVMLGHTRNNSAVSEQLQTKRPAGPAEENEHSAADDSMNNSGTLEPPSMNVRRNHSDLAKRRRGIVEPLHIDPHGESELTSDDDFLEELQSATLQEAKPLMMARSPVAPTFERRPSAMSVYSEKSAQSVKSVNIRRSSSNLLEKFDEPTERTGSPDTLNAGPNRSQSISTPTYEQADPMQGLKRNVSTGITRRIQALAETSREPSPNSTQRAVSPETSPQFTWRERKSSVRSPPRSRTSSWKSASRHSDRTINYPNPANVLQQAESAPTWRVQHDPTTNRDSVSVSARIVRPNLGSENEESASADASFQQPRLTVNHKRASASHSSPNKALPPLNTDTSLSNSESAPLMGSPSVSPVLTRASSSDYRTLHSSSNRKSFGRHKQQTMSPITPSAEDFPPPPIQKSNSRTSVASSNDENAAPTQGTRTSRFFKRMSNLGGKDKRRSGAQQLNAPSAADVTGKSHHRNGSMAQTDRSDMPPSVVVGDLNVQFPDSLLWKRRIVEISEDGYIVFSIPQAMDIQKNTAKRFHLSEFKQPYAPDLDRQELPHSVMLDFVDGAQTTLQAACEDGMTHRQVLHVLRSYWKAWAGQA